MSIEKPQQEYLIKLEQEQKKDDNFTAQRHIVTPIIQRPFAKIADNNERAMFALHVSMFTMAHIAELTKENYYHVRYIIRKGYIIYPELKRRKWCKIS